MVSLSSAVTSAAGTLGEEIGSLAEYYLKSQFLEKAIQIDEYYEQQYETEEALALKQARTDYDALATTGRGDFVKAALIPRDDTYSQNVSAIKFMFNPTELNVSREVNLNDMKGAVTSQGLPKVSYGTTNPYQIELAGLLFDTYEAGTNVLDKIQTLRDAVDFTKFGVNRSYVDDSGEIDFLAMYSRGSYMNLVDTDDLGDDPSVTSVTTQLGNIVNVLGSSSTDEITSESQINGLGSAFTEYDDYADIPLVSKHPPVYYFIWGEQNYMTCMITKLSYKLTMFLADGTPVRALVDVSLKEVDMRNASRMYSDIQNITK